MIDRVFRPLLVRLKAVDIVIDVNDMRLILEDDKTEN
jgi:hypothetical protein